VDLSVLTAAARQPGNNPVLKTIIGKDESCPADSVIPARLTAATGSPRVPVIPH
jgi:hypothetical protein